MTHEFKKIVTSAYLAKKSDLKSVLVTVVALEGSSYRRPGVRMLILENDKMVGAVSGGCVEKAILQASQSVFKTGRAKMMNYDGRYRLGCEGILHILLEFFQPNDQFYTTFNNCITDRSIFEIHSYFDKREGEFLGLGSWINFKNTRFSFSGYLKTLAKERAKSLSVFSQKMTPVLNSSLIGAEHDAVQLCQFATLNGWEVTIISAETSSKTISNFPNASQFHSVSAELMELSSIDNQTAIMMMTHNFVNDLKYLMALKDTKPVYIGLLGPSHRREKLVSQLIEYCPEIDAAFLESMHGPAGLNIGAETPQEIAISIISEILSVIRHQQPMPLHEKLERIHDVTSKKEIFG